MNKPMIAGSLITVIVLVTLTAGCGAKSGDSTAPDRVNQLAAFVAEHHQTPEDYILSKFANHDVVFLGERHRIKHDVALVRAMIPLLYERGIYNLGIEFANAADQAEIDRLITAESYDEALARQIQFSQWPFWGYQDYIDIYNAAWEVNHALPEGERTFRVLGLNGRMDWSSIWSEADRENPETRKRAFPDGDGDLCMGNTILREVVARGEKALVYSGINHAYTRYHQPIYDVQKDTLYRYNKSRMGNVVYDSIGDRAFLICLHHPWWAADSFDRNVLAADGFIDAVITRLDPQQRRAGFDVVGTPFGDLSGETSFWKHGYPGFKLSDYCDGYVIQGPLTSYEGVSVAEGFINESNRLAAAVQSANPATKDSSRTVEQLMNSLRADTDIQRIFGMTVDGYPK